MTIQDQPDFKSVDPNSVARYHIAPQDESSWVAAWCFERDEEGTYFGVPCRLPRNQLFSSGPNQEALMDLRYADGQPCFTLEPPAFIRPEPTIQCFVRTSMGRCRKKVHYRSQLLAHVQGFHTSEATLYAEVMDQIRKSVMNEDQYLRDFVKSMETVDETFKAIPVGEEEAVALPVAEDDLPLSFADEVPVAEPAQAGCADCDWQPKPGTNSSFALKMHRNHKHKEVPVGTSD